MSERSASSYFHCTRPGGSFLRPRGSESEWNVGNKKYFRHEPTLRAEPARTSAEGRRLGVARESQPYILRKEGWIPVTIRWIQQ